MSQPGMNGGPIVENRNGKFFAVGIHTINNQQTDQRGGIILTRPLFQHLYKWTIEVRG